MFSGFSADGSADQSSGFIVVLCRAAGTGIKLQLRELASYTVCPPHQKELEQLVSDDGIYKEQVLAKRLTMLDFLEDYPACEMPFERFLALLPSLKPRYYSISSSPKVHANIVSMTVGVVKASAWSGRGEYRGVASNYLAS